MEEIKKKNRKDEVLSQYKTQLQLDTLNAKNEANIANQKANAYLQNYLKSQGIANTGLGLSNYTNLANNYSNTLANIQANANKNYREIESNYETNRLNELQAELASMNSTDRANAYKNFVNNEGLSKASNQTLQSYYNTLNNTEINSMLNSDFNNMSTQQYHNYLNQLQNNPNATQSQIDAYKLAGKNAGIDFDSVISEQINSMQTEMKTANSDSEYNTYKKAIDELTKITKMGTYEQKVSAYNDFLKSLENTGSIKAENATAKSFGLNDKNDKKINALMSRVLYNPNSYDGQVFKINSAYYRFDGNTKSWNYIGESYDGKASDLNSWYKNLDKYKLYNDFMK